MKTLYLIACAMLMISLSASAQTTTTFTISAGDEDATIDNYSSGSNYPNEIELASRAWTISSIPTVWRSVFKFDMSCIPSTAIVQHASLSLYYAAQNNFGNELQESLTSSNESVVQRVTSAWTENTVTWNNQPLTTTNDEIILPQSTSGTQDYTNFDVTTMVQQMITNANNGFLVKLTNETEYANMLFASGDNPDLSRHPSLTVTYIVPGINCVTLRIGNDGEDATIDNYSSGSNYPNEIEMASRAWTISSIPTVWRSVMKFDFPCFMAGATIQSAHLSLYYAVQNNFGNQLQESLTSSNESVIQQIVTPWTENTVTWNNQPLSSTVNEVILPQSTSGTQDYTNMDVTAIVQQMLVSGNYGFMLKLTNEVEYANMLFASGDNPDTSKYPKLEICYSFPSAINENQNPEGFSIYPNPASGAFTIRTAQFRASVMEIFNVLGETIYTSALSSNPQTISTKFPSGIYFVKVSDGKKQFTRKLVLQ